MFPSSRGEQRREPDQYEKGYGRPPPEDDAYYGQERRWRGEMPLGYWFGQQLWNMTRGSARIDMIRPSRSSAVPMQQGAGILGLPALNMASLFEPEQAYPEQRGGRGMRGGPRDDYGAAPYRKRGLLGTISGARLKVMRHVDFGYHTRRHRPVFSDYDREVQYREQTDDLGVGPALQQIKSKLAHDMLGGSKPWFDLGFGLNFELDTAELDIKARVKVRDLFSIKLLPRPTFRLQKRVFLPGSAAAVRVNYEIPLAQALDRDRREPVPARLWLRMENAMGYGTHLTPSGLDFDEHSWYLGGGTSLRTGASISWPRQIPIPPGEPALNWRVQRLGLKTLW